jgi:hypothetical protein
MSVRELKPIQEIVPVSEPDEEVSHKGNLRVAKQAAEKTYTMEEAQLLIEQWRRHYNEVVLERMEELERHTWRNNAILRGVTMVSFTAIIGIVIASGVVGGGKGSHWSGPAWNTMWLYGLFAANAVSMFWTTHKE